MENKEPLLSICIPTYNRSEILDRTLSDLFLNSEFNSSLIEVIVSDNCSTDNTHEVVLKYPQVYYYCNDSNIGDLNFSQVLSYATGKYIKLFNDTLHFLPGVLEMMLGRIKAFLDSDINLLFYDNTPFKHDCCVEINSKIDYLKKVSYFSTWIANFGAWRNDFVFIPHKNRYSKLLFVQVDWSYRLVDNNKKTIIFFEKMFDVAVLSGKGGYNIFDAFVNNYLSIIKNENLPFFSYEVEKFRLCSGFIYPWLIKLFIVEKNRYNFELKGCFNIIWFKYWYEFYFYPMLLIFGLKQLKQRLKCKVST